MDGLDFVLVSILQRNRTNGMYTRREKEILWKERAQAIMGPQPQNLQPAPKTRDRQVRSESEGLRTSGPDGASSGGKIDTLEAKKLTFLF